MVEAAADLLAERGLQATSFGEVIEATGTSRGSIYHHFPCGKTELVEEALDLLAEKAFAPIEAHAGRDAQTIARHYVELWRSFIPGFRLRGGCVILTVTVTADSEQIIDRAAVVFRRWRERLAQLLQEGGLDERHAAGCAALIIAACEGALVFARAERSMEPFDQVAEQLRLHLATLTG
ncbi:TetR/AcrR family transcriptional regulator [Amycolatopsis sp. NPDC051903]|uniref:TetR/AcrR family transcriptional regulator n=1 Tax=Amycolatopsis sp. NPDC051903 TaxID=3363936 RepID=UPI0037A15EEB